MPSVKSESDEPVSASTRLMGTVVLSILKRAFTVDVTEGIWADFDRGDENGGRGIAGHGTVASFHDRLETEVTGAGGLAALGESGGLAGGDKGDVGGGVGVIAGQRSR